MARTSSTSDVDAQVADLGPPDVDVQAPDIKPGHVRVRVLPMGCGKVATGEHCRTTSAPLHHKKGDILAVSADVGEALEERGFGEVQS